MDKKQPLTEIARHYQAVWKPDGTVVVKLDGYVIDINYRTRKGLVVTFEFMQGAGGPDPATRPGWGSEFLSRRRLSTIHIKPRTNCWYRQPSLAEFFRFVRKVGFFEFFDQVMTYGSSMGGFGALSFAGLVGARKTLAIHPQVNLGPDVRSWEPRFANALALDWSDPLCDIDRQIAGVESVVIVYDRRHELDRLHVELIKKPITHLNLPYVGHFIPHYLVTMGVAGKLFDDCLNGVLDTVEMQRLFRRRRLLPAYQLKMKELTMTHPRRRRIVEAAFKAQPASEQPNPKAGE